MSIEPYEKGLVSHETVAKIKKRHVVGELVAISDTKAEKRELTLIAPMTRALLSHQIHELLFTDEKNAAPGKRVNSIAVLGFFEVKTGGLVKVGDKVSIRDKVVGELAGYDETHMPNHMNIIIKAGKKYTGKEMGLRCGDEILI